MVAMCICCKNKSSNDRCPSHIIRNGFCGKHIKVKHPRIWYIVNNLTPYAIKISKLWRGFIVRNRLKLAMVMQQSVNDDDIITFEKISDIHPFDRFVVTENSKSWCFNIKSILQILTTNLNPQNPYTRKEFSIETSRRLRKILTYRIRNNLQIVFNKPDPATKLFRRWLQVCQILTENDMFQIKPQLFIDMTDIQLFIFADVFLKKMKLWIKNKNSRKFKYLFWCTNMVNKFYTLQDNNQYSICVASTLLSILNDCVKPFEVCFIIVSCL
jgi:hypothetical protein